MRKWWVGFIVFFILIAIGFYFFFSQKSQIQSPIGRQIQNIVRPLQKYSFDNLRKYPFKGSEITIGKRITVSSPTITENVFYYSADVAMNGKLKKISGVLTIPKNPGNYPVIVMFRGFVPQNAYFPGDGTQPAAHYFAENGFITLAPDFLDYGTSDAGASDPWENRFQSYTTALEMLASVHNLNAALTATGSSSITADLSHIGLWGHSNGGHITLSVLSILGGSAQGKYPTVLWAPVSAGFPYSILYYTDEDRDAGKATRKLLAQFETLYNSDDFDPSKQYKSITAPLEIHQGLSDAEVPWFWTENLVDRLKKQGDDVTLFEYPGVDHNLAPANLGWNSAVARSVEFYKEQFSK